MKFVVAAGGHTVERVDWTRKPTGGLLISADPVGARVLVDGTLRGVTPLTIGDLAVGPHAVVLESAKGSIQRSVTIREGETARLDEVIFAGWLSVFSPFELTITEGARTIRLDDRHSDPVAARAARVSAARIVRSAMRGCAEWTCGPARRPRSRSFPRVRR